MSEIERRQACARLDRSVFVLAQRVLVATLLVVLVVKVLDCLVVDERVDGFGARVVLGSVHVETELGAPWRDAEREGRVAGDAADADQRVLEAEFGPKDGAYLTKKVLKWIGSKKAIRQESAARKLTTVEF